MGFAIFNMGICCDLQVDVNGEEIFYVDKVIILFYMYLFLCYLTYFSFQFIISHAPLCNTNFLFFFPFCREFLYPSPVD